MSAKRKGTNSEAKLVEVTTSTSDPEIAGLSKIHVSNSIILYGHCK